MNDISNVGGSGVNSDALLDTKNTKEETRSKKLTTEELNAARERITEHEAGIERVNNLNGSIEAIAAATQPAEAMALVSELKNSVPDAYQAIVDAASLQDTKAFEEQFKQILTTNLKPTHPELDKILAEAPYAEIQKELNPQPISEEPEQTDNDKGKGKDEKPKEEGGDKSDKKDEPKDDKQKDEGDDELSGLLEGLF